VLQIVRMRLGNKLRERVDSMDITQLVLEDAFKQIDRLEMHDDSSLLRWMAKMIENRIRNEAKFHVAAKRDAAREVQLDAPRSGSMGHIDVMGALPTPSVEVGRAEQVHEVQSAIAELPDRYREAVLLRDYTGAEWKDVAAEIDVATPDAARMLYSRALAKLGEILRQRGIE